MFEITSRCQCFSKVLSIHCEHQYSLTGVAAPYLPSGMPMFVKVCSCTCIDVTYEIISLCADNLKNAKNKNGAA
jgi:hypothetical protein